MGLVFRRSLRAGRKSRVNVSTSGVSVSHRRGPVTVSSRGRGSVRIGKGLSFRFRLW